MTLFPVVIALVAIERLGELVYAAHNTKALKRRGAVEIGRGHYPLFILLHASWLAAIAVLIPTDQPAVWPWLGVFIALQGLRLWVLASLGPFWTTRILTLPEAPLVRRGPYRWIRHPNYVVVVGEFATLPLAFGAWGIALVFSVLNLALLGWRIRLEERVLGPRRLLNS